jgi:hypothetical protein
LTDLRNGVSFRSFQADPANSLIGSNLKAEHQMELKTAWNDDATPMNRLAFSGAAVLDTVLDTHALTGRMYLRPVSTF